MARQMTSNNPPEDPERYRGGAAQIETDRLRARFLNKRNVLRVLILFLLGGVLISYAAGLC